MRPALASTRDLASSIRSRSQVAPENAATASSNGRLLSTGEPTRVLPFIGANAAVMASSKPMPSAM